MVTNKEIQNIAIYLRKSRDEGEYDDVLEKHREALISIANTKNWTYRLYAEIASGEKIKSRKEMQKLLHDVEAGLYDGVLVMDIDRLGRGNHNDWAVIKETFINSETLIITPTQVFDLEIEGDDMHFDMLSIFSKQEYRSIKRRMQQGKIAGAKKGMWTNGKPPFPYYYDRNTRKVEVDESKRLLYQTMKMKYLTGTNLNDIAVWLTDQRIPTPYNIKPDGKNKGWSHTTVQRLLASEFHVGWMIYGKTRQKKGRVEAVPDEEQIKVMGSHEPLKTQEEHDAIMKLLAQKRRLNPNGRRSLLPLSGLLYCEKCGYRMQFKAGYGKQRGKYWSAQCVRSFKDGSRCSQKGKTLDNEFYNALYDRIIKIDGNLLYTMQHHQQQMQETKALLQLKNKELEKHRQALEVIQEGYEEGIIDKTIYVARREYRIHQMRQVEEEIGNLETVLEHTSQMPTQEQLLRKVDKFKNTWGESESIVEKNRALRALVEKITYNREGNRIMLKILYR